jgi:hypothetical protein
VKAPDAKVRLDVLDPALDDPGYWLRFQRTIAHRTGPTLAERRRRSDVTLEGVLFTWGRMILPVAAVAVGVGVVLLVRSAPSGSLVEVAGVEDVLERPTGTEPLPAFLHAGEDLGRDLVLLAVELR